MFKQPDRWETFGGSSNSQEEPLEVFWETFNERKAAGEIEIEIDKESSYYIITDSEG